MNEEVQVAFIIGSPRSGTTILGNILDRHESIGEWYEPYYIWLRYFDNEVDDHWRLDDRVADKAREYLRREFRIYQQKRGVSLVVDKSPGHAFNIDKIKAVFPSARWIHILRDGRDTTLSIKKEWEERKRIVQQKNYQKVLQVARRALSRQPFWRYRMKLIGYEISTSGILHPTRFLNKSKWKGAVGWGPRFQGWEEYLATHSSLEFNAMQWVTSVESVYSQWDQIPLSNRLEIRYETLLAEPEKTLTTVLDFLGYAPGSQFFKRIPRLRRGNTRKWEAEFDRAEIEAVKPILNPMLEKTGYLQASPW
ncbi:MAG: sulfotransferase family protein [Desulfosudaceae bacterium]